MSQDQQTYQRAAHAALVGGLVQLLLVTGMALLGFYAESVAFHAATWYFIGGLPIWVILWVLFHQHRLERVEALEAEQLARADARTAALFDEAGQQLQLARKRLNNLYKWGLPIVSLLVATYLLGVGGTLLYVHWGQLDANTLTEQVLPVRNEITGETANPAALAILSIAIAFVAFLVARYVSGMTRVREWQMLRGGAAYLMGNALVALLLLAGALGAYFDNLDLLAAVAIAIPAFMTLLGVEIVIGFTLGVYRPRRPGDVVRPAFDSRILGWLSRPESLGKIVSETLNYQFGFEISRSWFYRLLASAVTPLIIIGTLVLVGLTSLVIVAPHEQAVITTFGRFDRIADPGPHFKWPWPAGEARKIAVQRVHQISVGSLKSEIDRHAAVLWTNEHSAEGEEYLLTAPTPVEDVELGADLPLGELAGGEVVVKWRIADLAKFIGAQRGAGGASSAEHPPTVLRALAERRTTVYFAQHSIDELLSAERVAAGEELRRQLQADVDALDLGIDVVFVGLIGVHPPQESDVALAFLEQIGALQEKETKIQEAHKEAVKILASVAGSREKALTISEAVGRLKQLQDQLTQLQSRSRQGGVDPEMVRQLEQRVARQELEIERLLDEAGGEAVQRLYEARAYRWEYAMTERARADRFASQLAAYKQAPRYYMMRQYLETLVQGLKDQRKYVVASEQQVPPTIRLELETPESGLDTILSTD